MNKLTVDLIAKLAALKCDPIEGMARIGMHAEATGDLNLAGKMYAELAQYVAPKRKAVEVSGDDGGPLTIQIVTAVPASPEATGA